MHNDLITGLKIEIFRHYYAWHRKWIENQSSSSSSTHTLDNWFCVLRQHQISHSALDDLVELNSHGNPDEPGPFYQPQDMPGQPQYWKWAVFRLLKTIKRQLTHYPMETLTEVNTLELSQHRWCSAVQRKHEHSLHYINM